MNGLKLRRIRLVSWAKVNLGLRILGHRQDGFHEIVTVLQSIGIGDLIDMRLTEDGRREVTFLPSTSPEDWQKSILRLLNVAMDELDWSERGIEVTVEKCIPVSSGLGGSSADYAGVLRALALLSGEALALRKVAPLFGSDVPGLFRGGTVLCRGRGEIVEAVSGQDRMWFGILVPPVLCDTAEMYRQVEHGDVQKLRCFSDCLGRNDFQELARSRYPQVDKAFVALEQAGAEKVFLSGSGSAVCTQSREREKASQWLEKSTAQTGYQGILCTSEESGYKVLCNKWGVAKW